MPATYPKTDNQSELHALLSDVQLSFGPRSQSLGCRLFLSYRPPVS